MGIEDSGKEQQQQTAIDGIGEGLIEPVVHQQQHGAEDDTGADPYYLHTRTSVKGEDVCLSVCVARTTHAHPSKGEEGEVNTYRDPVYRL